MRVVLYGTPIWERATALFDKKAATDVVSSLCLFFLVAPVAPSTKALSKLSGRGRQWTRAGARISGFFVGCDAGSRVGLIAQRLSWGQIGSAPLRHSVVGWVTQDGSRLIAGAHSIPPHHNLVAKFSLNFVGIVCGSESRDSGKTDAVQLVDVERDDLLRHHAVT